MKKNFQVGQSNEVIKEGNVFDLHNQYVYFGIVLYARDRKLRIIFEPLKEYLDDGVSVSLEFESVDYLEFSAGFGTRPIIGLDEVGYKQPEDRDDQWLMTESQSSACDHLFFRFDGNDFIRVHSSSAVLIAAVRLMSL